MFSLGQANGVTWSQQSQVKLEGICRADTKSCAAPRRDVLCCYGR